MKAKVPVYKLHSFPRHEPDALFYMTRLERLVQEFKDIDKPHSHTFYLVMWIIEGGGTHTIDFRTYPVRPHQLYFLTPGQVHSWKLSPDTRGFNLFFESNFWQNRYGHRLFRYPFYHSHQHRPLLEVTEQQDVFTHLFDYAYREYEDSQPHREEVFLSFVHIILEKADRLYSERWIGPETHLYDRLRQYEELLEQQFLTVREVRSYAEQMGMTPNHLNYICKKILGKTASRLFQERVVLEAQWLLIYSSQSIKEISFQLGFEDPSYFVRFFKKVTGQTPAGFRERQPPGR
ncbi:helix-turn-helix domain-containing protein [Larkinella soli]|uniref:helix-turn-helix domain-containing protein n=1 Tax=Larkinella soli TaxID=1770527 RepID=UPI000FFB81E2|nr:helix-turn-helix domain-containing protein [Larkinella soli]